MLSLGPGMQNISTWRLNTFSSQAHRILCLHVKARQEGSLILDVIQIRCGFVPMRTCDFSGSWLLFSS